MDKMYMRNLGTIFTTLSSKKLRNKKIQNNANHLTKT